VPAHVRSFVQDHIRRMDLAGLNKSRWSEAPKTSAARQGRPTRRELNGSGSAPLFP